MEIASLVLRCLHIGSAVILAGGVLFQAFALSPALIALDDEQRSSLGTALRARWSKLVMMTAGLLLITGLATVMMEAPRTNYGSRYMPLLGIKMLLAIGIMFLSSLLSGRTSAADKFRESEGKWQKDQCLVGRDLDCDRRHVEDDRSRTEGQGASRSFGNGTGIRGLRSVL